MRIQYRCGCGELNYNREDWLSHWKHGLNGKWRAVVLFFKTKIELVK
jgi:hypothetical protein